MDEKEKLEYLAGVTQWTEETYPRLAALDDSWKDTDLKDFDEGLRLATALQKAQGFLNSYQRYDVKRRLEVLRKLLVEVRVKSGMNKIASRPSTEKRYMAVIPPAPKCDEDGTPMPVSNKSEEVELPDVSGRRPEHLSQYMDKLPDDLRKEAQYISDKYALLAHWRSRAEYLAIDPRTNQAMISNCAKRVVRIEQQILNFWSRVDLAYNKATGKHVDENELKDLAKEAEKLNKSEEKSAGEYTKAEIDLMEEGDKKDACKRARIEANKKFLRRDDSQMTDERKAQVVLRVGELVEWGVAISPKAQALCSKYGIVIPVFKESPKAQPKAQPARQEPEAEPIVEEVPEPVAEVQPAPEEEQAQPKAEQPLPESQPVKEEQPEPAATPADNGLKNLFGDL